MDFSYSRIKNSLDTPVSNASLVLFRVLFGLLMANKLFRILMDGSLKDMFLWNEHSFTFYSFEWVQPLSAPWIYLHILLTALAALGVAVGFKYRTSCVILFIGWTWFWLMDSTYYLNHNYLISILCFWLIFMPANGQFSIDAQQHPAIKTNWTPAWPIWFIRIMMSIVYFYAGLAKIQPDWFQGEPMRHQLAHFTNTPYIGEYLAADWVIIGLFSYGGLIFDIAIAPALLWKRTRALAFVFVLMFHLTNHFLFNIDVFPWMALALSLMYFSPEWPITLYRKLSDKAPEVPSQPTQDEHVPKEKSPLFYPSMIAFILIMLITPFRNQLYGGEHMWTEEGHKFAWNLMTRSKYGTVTFTVRNPKTAEEWEYPINETFGATQVNRMAYRPEMIRQAAHIIAEELAADGIPNAEVRANAMVSLNARPMSPMIDSTVDLAKEPRSLRHYTWVLPHPGSIQKRETLRGKLVDANGGIVRGHIYAGAWDPEQPKSQEALIGSTSAQGEFMLRILPADSAQAYSIEVRTAMDNHVPANGRREIGAAPFMSIITHAMPPQLDAYTITLYREVEVAVNVVDATTSMPITHYTVQVGWNLDEGQWVELSPLHTITDAQGHATETINAAYQDFPNPAGFAIQVQAEGYDPVIQRFENMNALPETVDIALHPKQ